MKVRLLGAHQGENKSARFMSMLIDDRLAIDAGGMTHALSSEEQMAIDALLITHRHFDHIKDLPGLAHTRWTERELQLYCIPDTREAIQDHIFNNVVWPALREFEGGYYPVMYNDVGPGQAFTLPGYDILPIAVSHTVPTVGYLLEKEGKRFFYTADTRLEEKPLWIEYRPDLLMIETTMSSAYENEANLFGHLTPHSLEHTLRTFHARQGYYPRTVCVHMNPMFEEDIKREVAELSDRLGADVFLGYEGLELAV